MTQIAQAFSWLFVVVLGTAGLTMMLFPALLAEPAGFTAATDYGVTNLRTLGAPTLALAIITAIGAVRKDWLLILPAALYFLLNASARVISVVVEGYDPVMLQGLIFTSTLFVLAVFVLHRFKNGEVNALGAGVTA